MQDNNLNNNNQPDVFSELIKSKLENHQLPVDADCWNEIEARLNGKKKKRIIPFWWWLTGGTAVATLALFFTLRPLQESVIYPSKNHISETQKTHIQEETKSDKLIDNLGLAINVNSKKEIQKVLNQTSNLTILKKQTSFSKHELAQNISDNKDSIKHAGIANNVENNNQTQLQLSENKTLNKDSDSQYKKREFLSNSELTENNTDQIGKIKKNKNEWQLAAAVGSGGSMPSGGNGLMVANDYRNIVSVAGNYTSIMTPDNFTNISYSSPISFSFIVRKKLDNTLSIESGLVYTYLLTTYKNNAPLSPDAKLSLHYLGIPLNLVVQLWSNSKWEIYLSGGSMVEKGLRSVYVQHLYYTGQTITTTAATKIDGFQWSLNAAAGTTYKIQRNIGIFFEPKISYFFKNNQPASARTDQPTTIGLSAGLRYQFK